MTGTVFDLKRFSVHDGRGIRTTLFFKGCPLRCPWCQNPEGLARQVELQANKALCIQCGTCVAACPSGALALVDGLRVDQAQCTRCGSCVEACPTNALRFAGQGMTPEEAARQLLRDRLFWGEEGGVTLSGGEALFQLEFALELLALLKAQGVDTAVETCLYLPTQELERTLGLVDHYLVDIKYIDSDTHQRILGAPNDLILCNYAFLVEKGQDVLVRVPLIPGFTATEKNLRGIAKFLAGIAPGQPVELLNFNPLCRGKYESLHQAYPVQASSYSEADMEKYRALLAEEGLRAIKE